MTEYYDRDGKPLTSEQWTHLFRDMDYKVLAKTDIECPSGEAWVSTVWLGLDHAFGNGDPVIFETLVFCRCEYELMFRYCTEEQALAGHDIMIQQHNISKRYVLKGKEWALHDKTR